MGKEVAWSGGNAEEGAAELRALAENEISSHPTKGNDLC